MKKINGFTLIEILVVVAIIGVLASVVLSGLFSARVKAKDAKRKAEISQMGRLVKFGCYMPDLGSGEYDLSDLIPEIISKNPSYEEWIKEVPKDPNAKDGESLYKYIVNDSGQCVLFANLENENEKITLPSLTSPSPSGGTGVLSGDTEGPNGTTIYFQVSN